MNGAQALVRTLLDSGVDTCFTNPGTSEMHFVAALDQVPGMRCVLGLFEGVVTGAADGYYRVAGRPAATLLHLGPGLANGLANLHNAKKARSGVVNIVGEHATEHLALDAPLTSDIEGIARPMSHWVRTIAAMDALPRLGREAVAQARSRPGRIATLVLPADMAWSSLEAELDLGGAVVEAPVQPLDEHAVRSVADLLRTQGASTLLLLGSQALREQSTQWAGRIAQATGCGLMSEFYVELIERGAGRVVVPRLPYGVNAALDVLSRYRHIVLVGAKPPVAFFAYPGQPGRLSPLGCTHTTLAHLGHDPRQALAALGETLGLSPTVGANAVPQRERPTLPPDGVLSPASIGALLAALIPERAIIVDEAISTGRAFDAATRDAAPHDWLTNMGGSIGFGLPLAVGAAIAAPGRRVIALEGDGSAMYTPQALWTLAREGLDVTVLVFANRAYQILRGEFANVGAGAPGPCADAMLRIDQPTLDWQALSRAMGVPASRAETVAELATALRWALASSGPSLVEVVL